MVYPLETNITWVSGFDSMTSYTFGKKRIAHTFCSTCGTSMGGKSTSSAFADNRAVNVSRTIGLFSVEFFILESIDWYSRDPEDIPLLVDIFVSSDPIYQSYTHTA